MEKEEKGAHTLQPVQTHLFPCPTRQLISARGCVPRGPPGPHAGAPFPQPWPHGPPCRSRPVPTGQCHKSPLFISSKPPSAMCVPTTRGFRQRTPKPSPFKHPMSCPPASPNRPRPSRFATPPPTQHAVAELASSGVRHRFVFVLVVLVFAGVSYSSIFSLCPHRRSPCPAPVAAAALACWTNMPPCKARQRDQRGRLGPLRGCAWPVRPPPPRGQPQRRPA